MTLRKMERRETSLAIHPDQVLAKCANGQMEIRLAVLLLWLMAAVAVATVLEQVAPAVIRTDRIYGTYRTYMIPRYARSRAD